MIQKDVESKGIRKNTWKLFFFFTCNNPKDFKVIYINIDQQLRLNLR